MASPPGAAPAVLAVGRVERRETRRRGELKGRPARHFRDDARRRQSEMFRAVYNSLLNKTLIPTLLLADQIISSTETNFGATEIMDHYSKFNEKTNWKYNELNIPAAQVRRSERNCLDPQLEKCKVLLTTYE